jgi:Tol biopolymer transport system component
VKLASGARLGPYEIVALIGTGGMGEVYAARDTRLGRTVALKTLPVEFASDTKLKIRLEHEARAISALNHPHICALYDVGPNYLVMEHCEGKTLAKRIAAGLLPVEQVVEYGMQIADALEKAHRARIIHRDLKPSNIMITKSGVKLLDFGLAKQRTDSSPDDSTVQQVTEEGKILGTIQYMAPEVLHGKEADARSDIFALGLVLYEMAAGKPTFSGTSKASLIAAILEHEPPHLASSASLDRLIQACLVRDPDERIQSANDVKLHLRWVGDDVQLPQRPGAWRWRIAAALLVVAVTSIAATAYLARRFATVGQPIHAMLSLPALAPVTAGAVVLAPDGRHVAFAVGPFEKTALALYDLATGETRILAGTETAICPFWSPDSRQIGFFAHEKLKSININGGAIQALCDAPAGRGGAWSPRGVIVFAPGANDPLFKVSESGGTPVAVTKVAGHGWSHRWPLFLPDGETFLYVNAQASDQGPSALYAGSTEGKLEKRVIDHASNTVFIDGRLLFIRDHSLVAQRFDLVKLAVSGPAVPVVQSVEYFHRDLGNFAATVGMLVYVPAVSTLRQIVSIDPKTGESKPIGAPADYRVLMDLSADGRKAVAVLGDTNDISILSLDRGIPTRTTFLNTWLITGILSPDGKRLAYSASSSGLPVVVQSLETNASETVLYAPLLKTLDCWSPDGEKILLTMMRGERRHDVEMLDLHTHKLSPLLQTPADEVCPAISPDSRWLAYNSDESGVRQVYVTPFPIPGPKWQVSSDGGTFPQWSRDGRKLYFISGRILNVVDVRGGATPDFSVPAPLPVSFDLPVSNLYFAAPDGKIVTTRATGEPVPRSVHLVANWTKTLAQ